MYIGPAVANLSTQNNLVELLLLSRQVLIPSKTELAISLDQEGILHTPGRSSGTHEEVI